MGARLGWSAFCGGARDLLAAFMIVDAIIVLLAETSLSPRLYGVGDTATWKLRQQAALRVPSRSSRRRTRLGFTALMWLLVFVLRFAYSWGPWISATCRPRPSAWAATRAAGGASATAPVNELIALAVAFLAVIAPVFARQSNVSLPDVEQAGIVQRAHQQGLDALGPIRRAHRRLCAHRSVWRGLVGTVMGQAWSNTVLTPSGHAADAHFAPAG